MTEREIIKEFARVTEDLFAECRDSEIGVIAVQSVGKLQGPLDSAYAAGLLTQQRK